jgi:predicted metal-dependent peptidase|tara:strand:- start:67 stop:360 length:294 start_codon:yes stop_codon:yes gene_type:complete
MAFKMNGWSAFKKDDSDAAKAASAEENKNQDKKNQSKKTHNKSGYFGKVDENKSVEALNKFEKHFKKTDPKNYKLYKEGKLDQGYNRPKVEDNWRMH